MADLPSIANRLNDVEINNNAPVSSQTFRRVGSDINYLLDYLGIDNGDTIGGPISGLNVFSPVQSFTYTKTFTAADNGIAVPLFTFQGGGERPLSFFTRSSSFRSLTVNIDQLGLPSDPTRFVEDIKRFPIFYLLWQIAQQIQPFGISPVNPLTTKMYTVFVNGIQAGTVNSRDASPSTDRIVIEQSLEIIHAPAGTNTVTVLRNAIANASVNPTVSQTSEYVAL